MCTKVHTVNNCRAAFLPVTSLLRHRSEEDPFWALAETKEEKMRKFIVAGFAALLATSTAYAGNVTEADLAGDTASVGDILTNGMGRHLQRHSPLNNFEQGKCEKPVASLGILSGWRKAKGTGNSATDSRWDHVYHRFLFAHVCD